MKLYDLDNVPNSTTSFWKNWTIWQRLAAIAATIAVLGFIAYRFFLRDKELNETIATGEKKLTKAQKEKEVYTQFIKETLGEGISNQVKDKISKLPDEQDAE